MEEISTGKTSSKLSGLWRLFRFELPLFAGINVIVGEVLALGMLPTGREALLGFFSVFFISATSLILNDYFDLESDKINAPERPLPSGLVSKQDVVWLSIIIALLGFIAAYAISSVALIVAIVIWTIGFLYNWRLKRTGLFGNLLVGISVGMTFVFGGIVVGEPFVGMVWFFAVVAMLIDLGEEIAADAMDVVGDQQAGSQSLAVKFGPEKAMRISAGLFLFVVLLSGLPFLLNWLSWIYAIPLFLMDVIIVYSTIKLLDSRTENRLNKIRWIYVGASSTIILFLVMQLVI
ncbi:MAG: prenyltransferase [Chloroflexi bacterium]|nr:MAG: prenyltransferase [Chloroflexota bacterium]